LRTLIVDDERLARKHLRSLVAAHPEIVVIGEAATVKEAAALAALERPDLVLLDVQMPPGLGFDLLPLLPPPAPAIVFITAHDAFAVRAFEVSAVDYLLKPISPERLALALGRIREGPHVAHPFPGPPLASDETLILQSDDRIRRVALAEIAAVAAEGHYTRVYLVDNAPMFILRGITSWAAQLPPPGFLRVDRSLIVNIARVRALDLPSRDVTYLTLDAVGGPLELGRAATTRLRAKLSG
jgi:two-component system LytT family response regulator